MSGHERVGAVVRELARPRTIGTMAVHVDTSVPIHPITVGAFLEMVRVGILDEDDRVELLDGVLVEVSPQGHSHAIALQRLNMLAVSAAAAAGLEVRPQCPLDVGSDLSRPEPDVAIVPPSVWGVPNERPLLVIEVSVSSRLIDLGRKARIYGAAGVPEYWVLDMEQRRLVVHRAPGASGYGSVAEFGDRDRVSATAVALQLAVEDVLPPRP